MPHDTPLILTLVSGLTVAFLFGMVAYRLKLPPLVGYLVAGIAVGRLGRHRQRRRIGIPIGGLGRIGRPVFDLKERILSHRIVDFLSEVELGKLKQSDSVLEARRDRVLLPLACLKRGRIHGRDVVSGLHPGATRSRIGSQGSIRSPRQCTTRATTLLQDQ